MPHSQNVDMSGDVCRMRVNAEQAYRWGESKVPQSAKRYLWLKMADLGHFLVALADAVIRTRRPGRPTRESQDALRARFMQHVDANSRLSGCSAIAQATAFLHATNNYNLHHRDAPSANRNTPYSYCQFAMTGTDSGPGAYQGPPCCRHYESWARAHGGADASVQPLVPLRHSRSIVARSDAETQAQDDSLERTAEILRQDLRNAQATIRYLRRRRRPDAETTESAFHDLVRNRVRLNDQEFNPEFQRSICIFMQRCHLTLSDVAQVLPWVCKILTGYSLPCAHFPAADAVKNWAVDWHKEQFRTDAFASSDASMHLAGGEATVHGRIVHILHASYYDSDRHRPVTKQIGSEDVTGWGTAAALAALDAKLILRYRQCPERVATFTSEHAPVGDVAQLSEICGHKIIHIGCALHATSLELNCFLDAIKLPAGANIAPDVQDMTSAMQLVKLFNKLHSAVSLRLSWYCEQGRALCGWPLTLIPVALLTRCDTVANSVDWVVDNRERIVEFARALYSDHGQGIQEHREVWRSIAAALTNPQCLCILFMMHDFCQMWTLPNYRWFLSRSETTACLFRSAECPRKAAYMLLSLGSISVHPDKDHIEPYAMLQDYLAQLGGNGSLGNLRAQVAACLKGAHERALDAVTRFMARTWLYSPAVLFALGDPKSAARVVRAAAFVHARQAPRWTALSGVENRYSVSQLAVMELYYNDCCVHRLYTGLASAHGASQLLIKEMDEFYIEILFMSCLQMHVGDIDSLLHTTFSILADASCADCFADIAGNGHLHFQRHPNCQVQKWICDVVYPTPHTNDAVRGAFARAKMSLGPAISATSEVYYLPQGRSNEDIVAHMLRALSPYSSDWEPSASIQEL